MAKTNNEMDERNKKDLEGSTSKRTSRGNNKSSSNKARKTKFNSRNNSNGNDHYDTNSSNDFGWYNTIPELTKAAARYPFSRPLGTTVSYDAANNVGQALIEPTVTQRGIPGIMTIHWNPTVGMSTNGVSPINIISREIYSFVRHANSGASNYDAPDLMIYLLAMDSIYSMYQAGARAYGLMMMYTKENRYMPKELVSALGFNFDELKGNLAQFRWALNQVCYKISSLAVPNFMSYYLRHMWMNTYVYTDKPSAKAQMYAFVQDGVYKFDNAIDSSTFAGLKFMGVNNDAAGGYILKTVEDWYNMMEDLINPILASEDFGIMSGDILKAFGNNNLFQVSPIADDYIVVPTYNPEVLSQIQNLTIIGSPYTGKSGKNILINGETDVYYTSNIIQSIDGSTAEGYLYTCPLFETSASLDPQFEDDVWSLGVVSIDKLITSDQEVPDEAFVMVSTRLTDTPDIVSYLKDNNTKALSAFKTVHTFGSEIISDVVMYTMVEGVVKATNISCYGINLHMSTLKMEAAKIMANLSKFDWSPTLPIVESNQESPAFTGYYQDTNNYTLMTAADLNRLHEVALMSEFYVPQIGSVTRQPLRRK